PATGKGKGRGKPKEKEGELTITIVGNSGPEFYMLFLKKRADGKYEPVSGQIDPVDSVKMMSNYRE
ncbi:MAG TPA: hypothetical protein PLX97_05620, partial [Gemmatales bacterium]|nr:hypothetical protein [Gemmatales bacterium]